MPDKPNILVLMTDQQRIDTVSAYGMNSIVKTPHIGGIAQRGVRFSLEERDFLAPWLQLGNAKSADSSLPTAGFNDRVQTL